MKGPGGTLRIFLSFIKVFGVVNGCRLFFKIKFGNIDKIKVPGIEHPVSLRKDTSDIPAFYQVFLNREYDIAFDESPQSIIDGGANIGLFAIVMKNRFPNAKIVCLEPDPENFNQLVKNTSPYKNIICENCGVWNKETRLKVYDKYKFGKWGIVVEENELEGTVFAMSMNEVMRKHSFNHVDLLKLDIETSEKQVFSQSFEEWLPKTKIVVIELHDWIEKGCSKPFFKAINTCFQDYSFSAKGENVIIVNNDFLLK